jgi:hypothetical protein
MINRHALIIECSAIDGLDKLPGAVKDAGTWEEFLLSNRGGAWKDNEITILSNPTQQTVRSVIMRMNNGYGFVTFSGHGYVSAQTKETMVCLQGGNISETALTPSSSRATVILDSCRGVKTVAFAEAISAMRKQANDAIQYRHLFDTALENAETGVCKLYGCGFGQAAGEEPEIGGDFTQALIQTGKSWNGKGVFSLRNAYDTAEQVVRRKTPQQTPEGKFGRRIRHFPFAVQV